MPKTYTVIYRKGGRENFTWNRVGERFELASQAYDKSVELEKMGYPALIHVASRLDAIGLPETFDADGVVTEVR